MVEVTITRSERQPVLQRRGCNPDVVLRDQLAAGAKTAVDVTYRRAVPRSQPRTLLSAANSSISATFCDGRADRSAPPSSSPITVAGT
jgi:hypothetical protein